MARDINHGFWTGHLTRDCEVVEHNGVTSCRVAFASNDQMKSRDTGLWEDRVSFFDCTIYGAQGAAFAKYHGKGSRCMIEGKLRQDSWTDKKTGDKRSKIVIIAERWSFVGNRTPAEAPPKVEDEDNGTMPFENVPF